MLKLLSSLRLTVALLSLALVLVFVGTLAQVTLGLYQVQERYFQSFFVWWHPGDGAFGVPVFPGGYLLGALLFVNLIAAHATRFKLTRKKTGIFMVHAGLILLLLGQLVTDLFSRESALQLQVGETKNYSEDFKHDELVVINTSDAAEDKVIAVPESLLADGRELRLPDSPFLLRVKQAWPNALVMNEPAPGARETGATQGIGRGRYVLPQPPVTKMDERDSPAAIIELATDQGPVGTWLVSSAVTAPQSFSHGGSEWQVALRWKRHYVPYSMTLVDCAHDVYPGTSIPKNFSSIVRLNSAGLKEDREVKIYMNNPLRYGGATYYQYQMNSAAPTRTSTLQVVHNPGWLTPYFSCALVSAGLLVQFLMHLAGFISKRRSA